ncbi:MAG: cyclopropane-fatty-acyl-phospholipid synthase family protein [Rhodospirillales bacterium]|nr:cyclopropane-fatty-acyl-phospholipid synthase family protein [Rhodospirillales bacterium]
MLLAKFFRNLIRVGKLTVIDATGKRHEFKGTDGPSAVIRLHDKSLHWKIFFRPQIKSGEAFMDGTLTVEDGSIYDLLALVCMNLGTHGFPFFNKVINRCDRWFRRLQQWNPIGWSRLNVAHHYDLSGNLYKLFLDRDLQYSCAYFEDGTEDLESAQEKKKSHIANKLLLQPGQKILDIGSGWGGLALHLAKSSEVKVTGVTLSSEQLNESRIRASREGLDRQVQFHLRDYREEESHYDRIVSIGMFEHVGINHYDEFFTKVRDLLTKDGIAVLHTIGRAAGPGVTDPWIRKYIFPGGYCPALSEITPAIERAGLWITDVEILRLHYADTLREWRRRFLANRDKVLELYDPRFCRMWEYYLAASEASFRYLDNVVFQIQLAKRLDSIPISRNYLYPGKEKDRKHARNGNRAAA